MKKFLFLFSLSLALVFWGTGNAAVPFGQDITITSMTTYMATFDKTTGYEGYASFDVNTNTANVQVFLNNGDDWPLNSSAPPVNIAFGPDTGGGPWISNALWNTSGYSWDKIKNVPIRVTVNYSYSLSSSGWGAISAYTVLGNNTNKLFSEMLNNHGSPSTSTETNKTVSGETTFENLLFYSAMHVTGPSTNTMNDLTFSGYLTLHSVSFEFLSLIPPKDLPEADAGPNIFIEGEDQINTIIHGTVSNPKVAPLYYNWMEGSNLLIPSNPTWPKVDSSGNTPLNLGTLPNLSKGNHFLVLVVYDYYQKKVILMDEMILTVSNSAPHASPSGGGKYQVNTPVTVGGQVSDFDGDILSYEWLDGETGLFNATIQTSQGGTAVSLPVTTINNLAVGTHILTLQVSDAISQPVSANINVEIIDTIAPTLGPKPDKTILWPANHKMVPITILANAYDNSGEPVTLSASVASNEPQEGLGDGDTPQDWTTPVINNGIITLQLRAERSGKGNGRIYTVTIVATDASDNASEAKVDILVPHDKGK